MSDGAQPRVIDASFVAGATSAEQLPPPAFAEVAFAGRSNVGKSSLLNTLMQRKNLVRTSNTPGCTRQINMFLVKLEGGLNIHLVDLPGYGYARRSKNEKITWGPMLESYLRTRATLRAVVLLVDVRRGFEEEEDALVEFLCAPRAIPANKAIEVILVATKIDKVPKSQQKVLLERLRKSAQKKVIGFSATTGEGRGALWTSIRTAL